MNTEYTLRKAVERFLDLPCRGRPWLWTLDQERLIERFEQAAENAIAAGELRARVEEFPRELSPDKIDLEYYVDLRYFTTWWSGRGWRVPADLEPVEPEPAPITPDCIVYDITDSEVKLCFYKSGVKVGAHSFPLVKDGRRLLQGCLVGMICTSSPNRVALAQVREELYSDEKDLSAIFGRVKGLVQGVRDILDRGGLCPDIFPFPNKSDRPYLEFTVPVRRRSEPVSKHAPLFE